MVTTHSIISSLRKLHHLMWGGFLALFALCACMSDDDYSTSATDRLVPSVDTLSLDTIISAQSTNTYTFNVYNLSKKAIRLSRVYLENGSHSIFKVNVDGVFVEGGSVGTEAGIEVGAEDSLRVFVNATAPEQDTDQPILHEDRLVFETEGGASSGVVLSAYAQDVIPLGFHTLTADTLLSARRPYVITDSLVVAEGVTLSLAPGTRLYFHPESQLIVRGRMLAEGTAEQKITMRGDRLGYMFSNQPYDRIPNQWGGIVIASTSYGNHINHADIHSGTFGIRCDSADTDHEKLRLENTIVHNVSGDCLRATDCRLFVGNCQLTNAGGNCVTLIGGHHEFVHCTIANFYLFQGGRGVALTYANSMGDVRHPLLKASFTNCLITGYSEDEIMGQASERYQDEAFEFEFVNCLLNTPETEDKRIINCLWDNDKKPNEVWREDNFTPGFNLTTLEFPFTLNPKSQAVGQADYATTLSTYPQDILGRDRTADGTSDIGCYEAQPEDNKP